MSFRSVMFLTLVSGVSLSPVGFAESSANIRLIALNCYSCHGENGVSQGRAPSLSGLPANYLELSLKEYKGDLREGTIMPRIAKAYSDVEMTELAKFLVAQQQAMQPVGPKE